MNTETLGEIILNDFGGLPLMPITDKTRKILWGKSGNRCSICKQQLVIDATDKEDPSVVGEECHIISAQNNGPRHNPNYPKENLDSIENLILLCRIHHKMIDDQYKTYTENILREIKNNHETWVTSRLNQSKEEDKPVRVRRIKENIPHALPRLNSGKQIINIIDGAMGYEFDHDEPRNECEVELISGLLQYIQDLGDLLSDFESGERVRYSFELTKLINELSDQNYFVFGSREVRVIEGGKSLPSSWPIAIIYVRHRDNVEIQKTDVDNSEK